MIRLDGSELERLFALAKAKSPRRVSAFISARQFDQLCLVKGRLNTGRWRISEHRNLDIIRQPEYLEQPEDGGMFVIIEDDEVGG